MIANQKLGVFFLGKIAEKLVRRKLIVIVKRELMMMIDENRLADKPKRQKSKKKNIY